MDRMRLGAIAAIAAVGAMVTGSAIACGDKLVALGGGVGFERIVLSRYPGSVVLLLEPATGLTAANDKFNIGNWLALAGHDVHVVKDAAVLRQGNYRGTAPDVILVDATRARQLEITPIANATPPVILPVVYAPGRDAAAGQQAADCAVIANARKGMPVLQAVERALKFRSRGLPMPCEARPLGQQA